MGVAGIVLPLVLPMMLACRGVSTASRAAAGRDTMTAAADHGRHQS